MIVMVEKCATRSVWKLVENFQISASVRKGRDGIKRESRKTVVTTSEKVIGKMFSNSSMAMVLNTKAWRRDFGGRF